VGLVFQSPDDQLFPAGFEDVAYGLIYQGMGKKRLRCAPKQALEEVGMGSFEQASLIISVWAEKTGGHCTVLSMRPAVILFDEPTMGLDARAKKQFPADRADPSQTVLVATHDMRLAAALCSRLLILDEGHLVYVWTPAECASRHRAVERHGLTGIW
jgi:energy-coupling factor transporter ATP-binding protein EcfA2